MNITVVYNKPTQRALQCQFIDTEDDTADSAAEIVEALTGKGAVVSLVGIDEDHVNDIASIKTDLLFNCIEWTGLDLPLSDRAFRVIESMRIPYTGATRKNFMMTSDKIPMKQALAKYGLPTARWQVFNTGKETIRHDFRYPVIMKLALEHCSIGLTHDALAADKKDVQNRIAQRIRDFRQPVLVEEFIEGREFQVTLVETENGLRILPPAEIVFSITDDFLTYDSRWNETTTDYKNSYVTVPKREEHLFRAIEDISQETFVKLGFRDYARLDLRTRGNDVFILEANSNPGLSDSDEYGMTVSYKAVGWTFSDFVWKIVESAMRRFRKLNHWV